MSIFDSEAWSSCKAELCEMYSVEGRHYHTVQHIEDCLSKLNAVSDCENREALQIAIWFHDAIYNPLRNDNEAESAKCADEWLTSIGAAPELRGTVSRLIIATAHQTEPVSNDEKLIVDIDLSILGDSANDYDYYARNIRKEYAAFSDDDYAEGRQKVLRHFLERNSLYLTESSRKRFENQARQNLKSELARLDSQ